MSWDSEHVSCVCFHSYSPYDTLKKENVLQNNQLVCVHTQIKRILSLVGSVIPGFFCGRKEVGYSCSTGC